MDEIIEHKEDRFTQTYNSISNVFSRVQIKNAVESLSTYRERVRLIDHIIDRRQEIEQSNDMAKIHKYAHIFKRMIMKYRQKDNEVQEQDDNDKFKMEMVMQLFRGSQKKLTKSIESSQSLKPRIMNSRRLAVQLGESKSQSPMSRQMETVVVLTNNSTIKAQKVQRFFTEKDPLDVEKQVEGEIYDFLSSNRNMSQKQKEQFLRLNDRGQQQLRILESKVKHKLIMQQNVRQQIANKEMYQVQNVFPKLQNQFQSHTQIRFHSNLKENKKINCQTHMTKRNSNPFDESYASLYCTPRLDNSNNRQYKGMLNKY